MSRWNAALLAAALATACRRGAAPDIATAEALRACDAGDRSTCALAMRVLGDRCDQQHDAASCVRIARMYRQGRSGHVEKNKALVALGRACDAGDAAACNAAGEGILERDRSKAEEYRRKACDLGSGEGCLYLAGYVREGRNDRAAESEALYRRGVELHIKACARGDARACYGAGVAVSRDDEARALSYYRDAAHRWQAQCDGGQAEACYRLGAAYRNEKGVPFDADRARRLLDGACSNGIGDACVELGEMLREPPAPADAARAAALFERACLDGIERQLPCRQAGFLYLDNEGLPVDGSKAARLLDHGCALGDPWCCFKLGTMLTAGESVPMDRARGAELTRSAEGLEFRVAEVRRGTKMADPGLTAFRLPESSVMPTTAAQGQELILVAIEARRTRETAYLPVRKVYLVDAAGRLYANHSPGDDPIGSRLLERREFLFSVPAGLRPVKVKLELGGLTLDLPPEKKS
jgi:TPR repeat protein